MKTTYKIDKRALTIYSHYSQRAYRQSCLVPKIRLCGKWLEKLGFKIGDKINIYVSDSFLLIVPDKEEDKL